MAFKREPWQLGHWCVSSSSIHSNSRSAASSFSKTRNGNKSSVDIKCVEALTLGPARYVGMETLARLDQRREHFERSTFRGRFDFFHDRGDTLFLDRQIAVRTKLGAGFGE